MGRGVVLCCYLQLQPTEHKRGERKLYLETRLMNLIRGKKWRPQKKFTGKSIPSMRFKRLYSISLQIPVEVLLTFRLTVLGNDTNFTKIDLLNRLADDANEVSTRNTKMLLFQYNFSNFENVEIMKTSLTYVYTLSNTSYTFEADFPITKSLNSSRVLPTILPHLRRLFNQVYGVNDWQQKPETSTSCTAIWFEKCAQMVAGHDQDISTVFRTTAILQEIAITVNVLHNSDSVKYLEDIHLWTLKFNMSEVFNQAFDIPLNRNLVIRQNRWRRVVENTSHYNNYSQFVLEEKRAALHKLQLEVESGTNQCDNGHENQSDMWLLILWITPILIVVVFVVSLMMRESLRQKLVTVLLKPGDLKILYDNAAFNNQKNEVDYQYNKELELSKKDFKIEKNTVLGSGTFGIVYQGNVHRTTGEANIIVAVKTTQPSSPLTAITGMVSEIEVMSHLGRHDNIVNLVGIYTKSIRKGKIYLFLELCSLGSLDKYLRDKISMPNEEFTSVSVSADLYRWSCEISNAMDFLCLKRVLNYAKMLEYGSFQASHIFATEVKFALMPIHFMEKSLLYYYH
ncbi:Receptor-type tyrosine-protein kinase FLT3 [Orchesella cincta]|uniref:Receptor-type tyrosine-protein kinase FLT3 n=1 Tax=Orchesella cincta TaxID=48709 RepID=A0A1D2MC88_ORCCI|nr:Receptor-type tyrosine-protein kinase FLT3 [Orchesella cincta]